MREGTQVRGRPCRRGRRGFSLVEVLLAVLILSVGVLGVAGLALGVARESRRSAREMARAVAAQRALDSIRRAGFERAEDGRGALPLNGRQWAVIWTVTPEAPGLKRVEVAVAEAGDGRPVPFAATWLHSSAAVDSGDAAGSGGAR